jgi:hypothetical protein
LKQALARERAARVQAEEALHRLRAESQTYEAFSCLSNCILTGADPERTCSRTYGKPSKSRTMRNAKFDDSLWS